MQKVATQGLKRKDGMAKTAVAWDRRQAHKTRHLQSHDRTDGMAKAWRDRQHVL